MYNDEKMDITSFKLDSFEKINKQINISSVNTICMFYPCVYVLSCLNVRIDVS